MQKRRIAFLIFAFGILLIPAFATAQTTHLIFLPSLDNQLSPDSVPTTTVTPGMPTATPTIMPTSTVTPTPTATVVVGCVNLNTATLEELQLIINIGPDRAEEIITKRPFTSVDQLINISGIGDARLEQIKQEGLACV